jgi:hypothetical protein
MLLASYWVCLVPIFQSPDEDYHFDYVLSLLAKKRLITGSEAPVAATSHPDIFYLMTEGQALKFTSFAKVPKGYGTVQFFKSIDDHAPRLNTITHTNPVYLAINPLGYYVLTALWLGLFSQISQKLIFLFFAGRFLSVILLGCGLYLSYLVMKELKLSYLKSLLVLAAISFFPMVTMVGSYYQPDNFTFVVVSISFLLALRWRRTLDDRILYLLGLDLGLLLIAKYQFFCCVGAPVLLMIITQSLRLKFSAQRIKKILLVLTVPFVLTGLLQTWVSWGCNVPEIDDRHTHWFPVATEFKQTFATDWQAFIKHIWKALRDEYHSLYWLDGSTFFTFWGRFGWTNVPLVIGSVGFNDAVWKLIDLATKSILLLTFASLLKVVASLLQLVRKRRFLDACTIAFSHPVINSYFLFVIFFFLFHVLTYPSCGWQGRQWVSIILPIFLSAAYFAPRVISSRIIRERLFFFVILSWLCYSLVGSVFAIHCIHKRYYEEEKQPTINFAQLIPIPIKTKARIQHCDYLNEYTTFDRHLNTLMVPQGAYMHTLGWAVDDMAKDAAGGVFLCVDNSKQFRATYGLETVDPVRILHNKNYRFSGFGILLPTQDLALGWHDLTVKVFSKNGPFVYDTDASLRFIVTEPSKRGGY